MADCIFCKIVKGDIPATKVYEDDMVTAFLDIMPANKGHVLVIPNEHYESFDDLSKAVMEDYFSVAQRIAFAVKEVTGCDGYNLLMNTGESAGQVVMHAHLHIIPKFKNDNWKFEWPHGKYEEKEAEEMAEKIKSSLK